MARLKPDTAIAAVPLFHGLTKRQLRKLGALAEITSAEAGESIVGEGHRGDSFFVILAGQAKVKSGDRVVTRVIPGDHFGEISLLDGQPRSASVVAETPMTLLRIARSDFLKLLEVDAPLTLALMASMARTIRRADRSLVR
jgi:CRP/FNR family transcriptional regulator, cyclic AMP receptor protein